MTIDTWQPEPQRTLTRIDSPQDVAIQRLGEWARSAEAAHQIATTLVQTSFCPESFRNKPGEATAAILAGLEVGLQPMAALRSFDVISGQAAPRAITLRAIVQSHGHEMVLMESTATRCKMKGRRKGTAEWQPVTWTLDRAKDLGVTGKPNWRNQPQAMLVARATSELARLIASDAILGIGYSSEEVADGATWTGEQGPELVTTTAPTRRMSRRKPEPAPVAPEPDEEPVEPESPYLDVKGPLARHMFGALGDIGKKDRDDRLAYVSKVLGRTIISSEEMTDQDANDVIAQAEADMETPFDLEPEPEP